MYYIPSITILLQSISNSGTDILSPLQLTLAKWLLKHCTLSNFLEHWWNHSKTCDLSLCMGEGSKAEIPGREGYIPHHPILHGNPLSFTFHPITFVSRAHYPDSPSHFFTQICPTGRDGYFGRYFLWKGLLSKMVQSLAKMQDGLGFQRCVF